MTAIRVDVSSRGTKVKATPNATAMAKTTIRAHRSTHAILAKATRSSLAIRTALKAASFRETRAKVLATANVPAVPGRMLESLTLWVLKGFALSEPPSFHRMFPACALSG